MDTVIQKPCIIILGGKVSSVEAETLGTSQISLTFFDRLEENNIVRASGNILKCYDDFFEEMLIANELRKVKCLNV